MLGRFGAAEEDATLPPAPAGPSMTTGLGLLAIAVGLVVAAQLPSMRKNGRKRRARKGMRRNGVILSGAAKRSKNAYNAGYRAGTARAHTYEEMVESFPHGSSTVLNAIQKEGLAIAKRKAAFDEKERSNFANGYYFGVADAHGMG